MRRYREKDHTKRNQMLIGGFLIFLMTFSVLGYVIQSSNGNQGYQYEYNGQGFNIDPNTGVWVTELDGETYYFSAAPDSVPELPLQAKEDLKNAELGVLITFSPIEQANLQTIDLMRSDLDEFYLKQGKFAASGIYEFSPGPYSHFNILDCGNASASAPVIKFINSSNSSLTYDNYCLEVSGYSTELLRVRDSILYSMLDII